jgi:hypothetical protein
MHNVKEVLNVEMALWTSHPLCLGIWAAERAAERPAGAVHAAKTTELKQLMVSLP